MRPGSQHVLRGLAKRLVLLLLALAALLLAGQAAGAGVVAGALAATAVVVHVTAFGVAGALRATPPASLRIAAVGALMLAGGAGVWAASSAPFAFFTARVGAMALSPGGALLHLAAAITVAGVGGFVFLVVAGRATALGDGR